MPKRARRKSGATKKARGKKRVAGARKTKPAAKAKKRVPAAKRKRPSSGRPPPPPVTAPLAEDVTTAHEVFDPTATQQLSAAEVVGDIEESMALDKLTDR
ncbi:MAG: hypothetical protein AB1938_18250 [Myxococcota bacterium]